MLRDNLLGNTHLVLKGTEIVGSYLYEPFGKQITLYENNSKDRMSFIGKEKDIENELGDFGVRKYDSEMGRFTSIDPLWEKYYSWTPYHYCSNNPVMASDPSGLTLIPIGTKEQINKINQWIEKIENSTPFGSIMINILKNIPQDINIQFGKLPEGKLGEHSYVIDNNDLLGGDRDYIYKGARITLDNSKKGLNYLKLGHELFHALDAYQDFSSFLKTKIESIKDEYNSKIEKEAREFENILNGKSSETSTTKSVQFKILRFINQYIYNIRNGK